MTSKKRVQITLSLELEDVLNRLSRLSDLPLGTVARLLLEEGVPAFRDLVDVLESTEGEEQLNKWRKMVLKLQKSAGELPFEP